MTETNFWDYGVWSFVVTLTVLLLAMMTANILRNSIKPLRSLMIPSSVLGGFLLLGVSYIYKSVTGNPLIETSILEMLTYHGLGLGFVAMSLRNTPPRKGVQKGAGSFDTGVTVVATYLLQGIVGLAISIGLFFAVKSFFASGILLPMGFGQGPGQAYNWGRTYENTYGFVNGTSFGITIAALGFVAASIGGVIYLNILRKKGKFSGEIGKNVLDENLSAERITGDGEIPLSESMDKLTVQVALVFIAYALAYLFMYGVNLIIHTGILGNFGFNTVQPLIWGFNFLFGTIFAMLLKNFLKLLKKTKWVKREYTNNFMQTRIAGFMFDIMVVASIGAIDLSAFAYKEFIVPLITICVVGSVATYLYLDYVCKKNFSEFRNEAFLSLYGMLTGTASTGIILLREFDPKFETPAANNLVYQQPWAIVFGFPMLLLLGTIAKSVYSALFGFAMLLILFIVMNLISFRRYIFKRRKKQ